MRLRVLGSSGAEFPGFNPPAFLIDDSLLLDAGTIGAVLGEAAQWKIRHILITHAHLDHIRGIPFLADNIIIKNKKHSVTVSGIPQVLDTLKKSLFNGRVWPDFTVIPSVEGAVLKLHSVRPERPFRINSYTITAYKVTHSVPAAGYVIENSAGRRLLYTGDTGPTGRIWRAMSRAVHAAVIEVSMPNRMKEMAVLTGHLTAGLLKEELKKMMCLPERILITHPKPQYLAQIKKEVAALGMKNISILRDGEIYRI